MTYDCARCVVSGTQYVGDFYFNEQCERIDVPYYPSYSSLAAHFEDRYALSEKAIARTNPWPLFSFCGNPNKNACYDSNMPTPCDLKPLGVQLDPSQISGYVVLMLSIPVLALLFHFFSLGKN